MKGNRFKEGLAKVGYVLACIILGVMLVIAIAVLVQTIQKETVSVARIRLHLLFHPQAFWHQ